MLPDYNREGKSTQITLVPNVLRQRYRIRRLRNIGFYFVDYLDIIYNYTYKVTGLCQGWKWFPNYSGNQSFRTTVSYSLRTIM